MGDVCPLCDSADYPANRIFANKKHVLQVFPHPCSTRYGTMTNIRGVSCSKTRAYVDGPASLFQCCYHQPPQPLLIRKLLDVWPIVLILYSFSDSVVDRYNKGYLEIQWFICSKNKIPSESFQVSRTQPLRDLITQESRYFSAWRNARNGRVREISQIRAIRDCALSLCFQCT